MAERCKTVEAILQYVHGRYEEREYPALRQQMQQWRETQPLAGVRVLDATPLFTNTLLQYAALLLGGAELTVAIHDALPHDPALPEELARWGIPFVRNAAAGDFDCVLDCGGAHSMLSPRCGFAELTRSGFYHYRDAAKPVIFVDDSRIKAIETCLGTGDGFLRAMKQLGHCDFAGRSVVLFGYGKVGRGIAYYLMREGARVTVVDEPATQVCSGIALADRHDRAAVANAVRAAWCVVTATGVAGAMCGNGAAEQLLDGPQLVAAMGVEDEWKGTLPAERILNHGQPLNFMLDEPTRLRYIDPTMALFNAAALELVSGRLAPGVQRIASAVEAHIWSAVERNGLIADELAGAGF